MIRRIRCEFVRVGAVEFASDFARIPFLNLHLRRHSNATTSGGVRQSLSSQALRVDRDPRFRVSHGTNEVAWAVFEHARTPIAMVERPPDVPSQPEPSRKCGPRERYTPVCRMQIGCANHSWSSANRNKSRLLDLQAESLGSLSPGQRPGIPAAVLHPEGVRLRALLAFVPLAALQAAARGTPYPGRCPGLRDPRLSA